MNNNFFPRIYRYHHLNHNWINCLQKLMKIVSQKPNKHNQMLIRLVTYITNYNYSTNNFSNHPWSNKKDYLNKKRHYLKRFNNLNQLRNKTHKRFYNQKLNQIWLRSQTILIDNLKMYNNLICYKIKLFQPIELLMLQRHRLFHLLQMLQYLFFNLMKLRSNLTIFLQINLLLNIKVLLCNNLNQIQAHIHNNLQHQIIQQLLYLEEQIQNIVINVNPRLKVVSVFIVIDHSFFMFFSCNDGD